MSHVCRNQATGHVTRRGHQFREPNSDGDELPVTTRPQVRWGRSLYLDYPEPSVWSIGVLTVIEQRRLLR
jgi:hypothetical protein